MRLSLNENWEMACKRFDAFWEREIIDRPCLQLYAPRDDAIPLSPQNLPPAEEYWTDPETFYCVNERWFSCTHYLAEAFPVISTMYGGLHAILGAEQKFSQETIWRKPFVKNLRDLDIRLDHNSPVLKRMMEITKYSAEQGAGKCFVSYPTGMANSGDTLAIMRGYENFCIDVIEMPEKVKELETRILECWLDLYNIFYDLIQPYMKGTSLTWLPVWFRGKAALAACDFSAMISPKSFQDLFLPGIIKRITSAEKSIYHLDGPDALKHLDMILDIPELDGIQWVPGAGSGKMTQWIDILKKIQGRNKCLHIECQPDEVEEIVSNLSPYGLMLSVHCNSLEEAKHVMKMVEHSAMEGD